MEHESALTVNVAEKLSKDLALREVADSFLRWLENQPAKKLIVDFADINSISRSFAHQYVLMKNASHKSIEDINVPDNVAKMLKVVESQIHSSKHELRKLVPIEVITV